MMELATLSVKEQREHQIESFRHDAREHPERPDYQLHLASLLLADGQKEEALREFRTLLGLNAISRIWDEAGSLLLKLPRVCTGAGISATCRGERPSARLDLALALLYLEGPESALQCLEKVSEGELSGDGLLLKANILEAAGRKAEAERELDLGLRKVSTKPQVVQQAALMLLRLNRKADALDLLEKAISANPQDQDLPLTKGMVLGLMAQLPAAEKTFLEIESRWPEWDRVYLAHGLFWSGPPGLEKRGRNFKLRLHWDPRIPVCDVLWRAWRVRQAPPRNAPVWAGLEQMLMPGCKQLP